MFIDGQLLISTQTLSRYANSLFSASALDLPRRGIVHFKGGIGTLAKQLETSFKSNGGTIHFKEKVISISKNKKVKQKRNMKQGFLQTRKIFL